jgi:TIGR00156 family protein
MIPSFRLPLAVALFSTVLTGGAAHAEAAFSADNTPPAAKGGFSGPGPSVSSVSQAKKMRDDSQVVLRGNIVQQISHEKYLFQDSTGTVIVDIDDKDWAGQIVTPQNTVEIYGEVDKDWNSVEVNVERVVVK